MRNLTSLLLVLGVAALGLPAFADDVTCKDSSGLCTLEANGYTCECSAGTAVNGVAVDGEPDALAWEVTEEACLAILEENCGAWEVMDTCESDKGACEVYANGFVSCTCADGMGSGGGSSEPGWDGGDDADDAIEPDRAGRVMDGESLSCDETLLAECPNDPPDPADACSSDALSTCTDVMDFYAECYEQTVWPFMVIDCCANLEREDSDLAEIWACMQEKGCEAAFECYPSDIGADEALFGAERDSNQDDGAPVGDDADKEEDGAAGDGGDGGCSQTTTPTWLGLLALMGLALRRRLA